MLINLESRRIDHEPTVPQPGVRGQRSHRLAELRVLSGVSYRSKSERGHVLVVVNAALGRGCSEGAYPPSVVHQRRRDAAAWVAFATADFSSMTKPVIFSFGTRIYLVFSHAPVDVPSSTESSFSPEFPMYN